MNDLGAGMWATIGILSALMGRQESGLGCRVETSLFETAAWWLNYHVAGFLGSGVVPVRQGTGTPFIAPYEVYPAADEGLLVCVANDNLFRTFVGVLNSPQMADDTRFSTNPVRVKNRVELRQQIIKQLKKRKAEEWEDLLNERNIPCSRIKTVADFVEEEQLKALNLLTLFPHPAIPDLKLIDLPVSQDGKRAGQHLPPPTLGSDTDAILDELGYSAAEVADWREQGIIT